LFAQAAIALLQHADVSPDKVSAIGSHGQTIRHEPRAPFPYSLQIGNPNVIAEITGITTVADFRRYDIAAGGEGAPLVPAFHNEVFRSPDHDRVVVNIGGIANITLLPGDRNSPVLGFDTGPGNVLMDGWCERHLGAVFDNDGQWCASGNIHAGLLDALSTHSYFDLEPPKSTGREDFNLQWLDTILRETALSPAPQDVQATLCELTAWSISKAIHTYASRAREVLVCGGGAHNRILMQSLKVHLQDIALHSTEQFGIPPDWVESAAFAWIAKQTLSGRPGNLPSVTGAKYSVVLGGIYQRHPA
jgi:anhydro-N-acetylmuramic acid kinase